VVTEGASAKKPWFLQDAFHWVFILSYSRFGFEVISSLVVAGDAVVTWSTLNGALGSSSTFMAQIDLPPWLARTVLILIVCSSYSTPAEAFIAKTWSETWAVAYLCKLKRSIPNFSCRIKRDFFGKNCNHKLRRLIGSTGITWPPWESGKGAGS
jgi:hypothetical protein